ncbi:MAG: YdcF family protein [Saprospiraceae bacterium]
MFYFLSKCVGYLLSPVVWIIITVLIATFSARRRSFCIKLSLAIAVIFSNPFLANVALIATEYPATSLQSGKTYNAILLGGILNQNIRKLSTEFNPQMSSNRLLEPMQMMRKGQIQKLIITSGPAPFYFNFKPEALALEQMMFEQGIPERDIYLDTLAVNTWENAKYSKQILDQLGIQDTCLLITSALHMPRALRTFQQFGIKCKPYPVDYEQRYFTWSPSAWLIPNAESLYYWETILHEWMGSLIYSLRSNP